MIKQEIEHEEEIRQWLSNLPRPVSWNAERLPALTQKVLFELLKAERRNCPAEIRKKTLEAQNHNCALCGSGFDGDPTEWDHANPLQQTCKGQETQWQAICAQCHSDKTGLEGKQDRSLESRFSLPVYEAYVQSPRPPPLVFRPHEWKQEEEVIDDITVVIIFLEVSMAYN